VSTDDYSQPILTGRGGSDYERYLRTDDLLELQKEPEEMVHRDERLFQTVHQSSELWLKLCWFEVERATELLDEGDLAAANRLLRRAIEALKNVTQALDMLEHLSPWEYQEIRRVLGHGSGFDSPGWARLRKDAPALVEAWHKLRRAEGLSIVELYQRDREFEALFQIGELLIEFDERVTLWRVRHLKVIERVIGGEVVGTQGTPVELLSGLVKKNLYPELWRSRTDITNAAKEFD
jgi:tryptophan 2,3-dioxygenase